MQRLSFTELRTPTVLNGGVCPALSLVNAQIQYAAYFRVRATTAN
jgi:hypothetical protein